MENLIKLLIPFLTIILSGCASTTENSDPNDPYESLNRASYSFNKVLDKTILRPTAKGYDAITPRPVKVGISNFFSNLGEVPTILNDLLQGKFYDAFSDTGRFVINTTLGLGGFIDVATDLGIEEHDEDFGQTLGIWGVDTGAYVMLPFLGPSTIRDALGRGVDHFASFTGEVDNIPIRNSLYVIKMIDLRHRLLAFDGQLEDSLDEYSFVKDAYLMRRQYQVFDGNPPEEDDFYDDCEDEEDDEDCDNEIID